MKEFTITALVKEYDFSELSEPDRRLIETAKEYAAKAYAPYSGFNVGAALLMDNGRIEGGSNQENAAYPSGLCAERTAVFHASATHPGVAIKKLAVAAGSLDKKTGEVKFQKLPVSPCGSCRQAFMEYENLFGPIEVLLYGEDKVYVFPSIRSLLPYSFTEF